MRNMLDVYMNKVVHGDCLEVMKDIDDNSIDCVVTDPPYGMSYYSNYYKNGNPFSKIKNDDKIDYSFIQELKRIMKKNSAMFIFSRIDFFPTVKKELGGCYKNTIIWLKNNWSAGDLYGDFGNQYELIILGVKGRPLLRTKRYSNVWKFKRVKPEFHPTQKPLDLIERCVETFTDKNNLVLDCFSGCGTTCLASKKLNRNFIGIELEYNYCKIASERIGCEIVEYKPPIKENKKEREIEDKNSKDWKQVFNV